MAELPRPSCRALRYASNRSLRVLALKDLLACALHQVALVGLFLPTCGDSCQELHAPHRKLYLRYRRKQAAPLAWASVLSLDRGKSLCHPDQPEQAAGRWTTHSSRDSSITILRSTIGVPSIASSAPTRNVVGPSNPVTVTRWTPIGFGRSGERVLKTPVSGMRSSPVGWVWRTRRSARCKGEHDQLVTRFDAVQRVGERGIDLQQRFRCARECLVGGTGDRAQRRANDPDWVQQVGLGLVHSVCESRTRRCVRCSKRPVCTHT